MFKHEQLSFTFKYTTITLKTNMSVLNLTFVCFLVVVVCGFFVFVFLLLLLFVVFFVCLFVCLFVVVF